MRWTVGFILLLFVAFATAVPAQIRTGSVSGRIVDETGGVLPGAVVTLRASGDPQGRSAVTDSAGRFTIAALSPGSYQGTVTLSGFGTMNLESVTIIAEQTVPLDLVMRVSSLQDTVTVRGTAQNYASSVDGKRTSDGIVDLFNTDEIGRLPDKNIGETLNRIPGVSMLLEKGEGRFIQIRGISPRLNNITINGLALGNAETESGGRLAPLDVVGGELLSGVQVLKSASPDMDGQGIGGTLNLTTKQPFDFADRMTALFSFRSGIETIDPIAPADTKETPYTLDGTIAGQLMNRKVGWITGASFSRRTTPLLGIYNDDWHPVTLNGQTVTYPISIKNNVTVTARERLNLNGGIETRPNPASKYFVRSFFAHWDELQLRNRYDEGLSDALTAIDGPNGGTISGNRVQVNLRSEPTIKQLFSTTLGGAHSPGRWTIDYALQRNQNSVHEPNDNWEFRSGATTFGPDTFRIDDNGLITITSPGRDRRDPAFQTFRRVRFFEQLTDETSYAATFDVRRDVVLGSSIPGFVKAGGKFTRASRNTGVSQSTYNIDSLNWTAATAATLNGGAFVNPVPIRAVPNIWLDIDGLTSFFLANRDDARYFRLDAADTYLNEFQSDFDLRERVVAAYVMGKAGFGALTLTGGVRLEQTDVESSAFTMVSQGAQPVARPVQGEGNYTNVLPSVNAAFDLSRNVIARAAWARRLGRPEFDALAPRSQLGIEDNPGIGTIGTLTIGNPDLAARESNNLDLSVEWYFRPGSLLSAAFFRKDITNEIIPAPTVRLTNHTFQGQTFDRFDIRTTINAEDADVQGVELTLADQLRFLPAPLDGLGVAGSITLIDSGIDVARGDEVLRLPLLQQADQSTSLTVYYQKGRWDLSGTYKYNANFLTDYGASRALDLDQGSFGRFDFRTQYNLTRDTKLTFSGINLNDEPTTEFQGGNARQFTEYEYTGRTFFFGVSSRLSR